MGKNRKGGGGGGGKKASGSSRRRPLAQMVRKGAKGAAATATNGPKQNGGRLTDLLASAQLKGQEHEDKTAVMASDKEMTNDTADAIASASAARAFYKEYQKVLESADVILQVLDARDPLGSRSQALERGVLGSRHKRMVFILNKADLVPKDNLQAWLKYLRREFPAVAFKSSTQSQTRHLGQSSVKVSKSGENLLQSSLSVGTQTLMALLGNYCRNKDIKTSIRVGVVGQPNVGKSSLINSLKRQKTCHVGDMPGVTRNMQEINLDSKIKLLDSPGLVLDAGGPGADPVQVALRNAVKVESLADPVTPVQAILQRCDKAYLLRQYGLDDFTGVDDFLALLALKMGRLKRNGLPDREKVARTILNDWNRGKIRYFTHPPELPEETGKAAEIVATFSEEFSLDKLAQIETQEMDAMEEEVKVEGGESAAASTMGDDEPMETAGDKSKEPGRIGISEPTLVKAKMDLAAKADLLGKVAVENPQRLKKLKRLREKKAKKDMRRRNKVAEDLSDKLEMALDAL